MTTKWYRARGGIGLSNKKKDKSNTGDDIDLDEADNKYSLLL